jgi:hypothetical protein
LDAGEIQKQENSRVAAEKTQKRAGATPLFRLSAAQKVSWGRLPPCTLVACRFFRCSESEQTFCNAVRSTSREQEKEETGMALLKAPSKKNENYNPSGSPRGRSQTETGELR